jgi:hypothetical protein
VREWRERWSGPREISGPQEPAGPSGQVGQAGNRKKEKKRKDRRCLGRKKKKKKANWASAGLKEERRERGIGRWSLRGFLGLELLIFCFDLKTTQHQTKINAKA